MMRCLFCGNTGRSASPFEDTVFNNKTFSYNKCPECGLVYVHPLPVAADFDAMYPVSYQGHIYTNPSGCYDWLFHKIADTGQHSTLLDYGCGNSKFVTEALSKGFSVTGVEYNPDLVEVLKEKNKSARYITITDFYKEESRYDVIFLGNVLEHLIDPLERLEAFKHRLTAGGIIVLEGPVENNFTLAGAFRKAIFSLRKWLGRKVAHAPRHIFYSNYQNQLSVFEKAGYEKLVYEVKETAWPFPGRAADCRSAKDYLFLGIAKVSKAVDKLVPKSGNVFFYVGRVKKDNQ